MANKQEVLMRTKEIKNLFNINPKRMERTVITYPQNGTRVTIRPNAFNQHEYIVKIEMEEVHNG